MVHAGEIAVGTNWKDVESLNLDIRLESGAWRVEGPGHVLESWTTPTPTPKSKPTQVSRVRLQTRVSTLDSGLCALSPVGLRWECRL